MLKQSNTSVFFFFNDTATTEIYTLSLHDALPISISRTIERERVICTQRLHRRRALGCNHVATNRGRTTTTDRKSTRLNSSHLVISYAVFCLKKKRITS